VFQYLRLLNPFTPITNEADARAAARAGAVGLFLTAAWSVIALFVFDTMSLMRSAMTAGMTSGYRGDPAAEKFAEAFVPMMVNFALGTTIFFVIGYVILGVVQWKKQTSIIPLLLLLWTAVSWLMALTALLPNPALAGVTVPAIPVGQQIVGHGLTVLTLLLYIAGFRGGSFLQRLERPAQESASSV